MIGIKITLKNPAAMKKMVDKDRWNDFTNQLLQNIGNEAIGLIKKLGTDSFVNPTGNYEKNTRKKIIDGKKLIVSTDVPYANALEHGFKEERPMTWLIKPDGGSIQFKGNDGKQRFYKVTEASIGKPANNKSGKSWTYPKRDGYFIYKRAYAQVVKIAQQKLGKAFKFVLQED